MTCDDARERFEDFLHDRLSPEESHALHQHLSECPRCPEELDAAEQIASLLRTRASYHRAPDQLRESILRELRQQSGILGAVRTALHTLWTTPAVLCPTTAAIVLALALPLYHHWVVPKPQPAARIVGEGTRDYTRLLLSYPPQGTSPTDPTQIQRWFQEALGFSPPIHFWGNQDFRLLRGYPTYIMERRAACLIFKTGDVISTLYIFPGPDVPIPPHSRRQIDGFAPYLTSTHDHRVLLWKQGDLAYLIVSRLADPQLDQLFLRIRKP
ncbi:MAG: zf-HC2 domain-containing protein [Nitrospinae bacterium]|nr:zf-HC2 domain-containing protein [Nitrospinota bacterium]